MSRLSIARKTFRTSALALTTLLAATALTGCAGGGLFPPTPSGSVITPGGTPTPLYVTAPLTGVQYEDGTNPYLAGPVVMGKIDNSMGARPQAALQQADMVFDEMVEGGLTRFLAVWHSNLPDQFGPLRSVRPMDPDIASPFGGIIAYSGGQKPFVTAMVKTGIYNASETSEQSKDTMVRVTDRYAPHNLFVKAKAIQAQHLDLTPPPATMFSFAPDWAGASAVVAGTPATSVTSVFPEATALWTWSGKSLAWLRTQDGQKHLDAATGKQLTAVNVIVLRVAVDRSYRDPRYSFVPKTLLEGTGKGIIFTHGQQLAINWAKASASAPVILTDASGAVIKLAPGNTWFELVPTDVGKVTVVAPKPATPSATPSPTR
jgi:hypothetical protein